MGNSALAADAKLEEVKQETQEHIAENRDKMEKTRARTRQKLEQKVSGSLQELQQKRDQGGFSAIGKNNEKPSKFLTFFFG